jgi:hypothetical protein
MDHDPSARYQSRQENDGTWTVVDTSTPSGREARMISGVSENRARQYLERLNSLSRQAPSALGSSHEADEREPDR